MSRTRTLANLRTEVRERADVDSNYIEDAQLDRLINAQLARLYRVLVQVNKDFYFEEDDSLAVTSGNPAVAMPADCWRVLGVDVQYQGQWYQLYKYNRSERNRYQDVNTVVGTRYRIRGGALILAPTPGWTGTLRVQYIPAPPVLVNGGDTWDGFAGYEEFAVVNSVISLKNKQEEDVTAEMVDRDALFSDIMATAENDDAEPNRVRDVEREVYQARWGT